MARGGSGRRRYRGVFWDTTDRLTVLGLQIGAVAFSVVSVYLLWGIISGALSESMALGAADLQRVMHNIQLACRILTVSGIVIIVSGSIRFYLDEVTGYFLFISGAVLRWGMPVAVGSSLREVTIEAATLPAYVAAQYSFLGTVALVAAVPFLLVDFARKLRGSKRRAARQSVLVAKEEEIPKSRICIFCWQMPYCRDYLRRFCQAYERRKSCWRIKSGCYCDEDMILRVMKRSATSKVAGFDQRYASLAGDGQKSKDLTGAQRRQRCRECFIYVEHQKLKYRLLSPLAFPATILLMWVYLVPVKAALHGALELTDKFAGRLSYGAGHQQILGNQWGTSQSASNTVEWLFMICLGLMVVTYILRGMEYFIFDLQV